MRTTRKIIDSIYDGNPYTGDEVKFAAIHMIHQSIVYERTIGKLIDDIECGITLILTKIGIDPDKVKEVCDGMKSDAIKAREEAWKNYDRSPLDVIPENRMPGTKLCIEDRKATKKLASDLRKISRDAKGKK